MLESTFTLGAAVSVPAFGLAQGGEGGLAYDGAQVSIGAAVHRPGRGAEGIAIPDYTGGPLVAARSVLDTPVISGHETPYSVMISTTEESVDEPEGASYRPVRADLRPKTIASGRDSSFIASTSVKKGGFQFS